MTIGPIVIERTKKNWKIDFFTKYFKVQNILVSYLGLFLFLNERMQGQVSIPTRIKKATKTSRNKIQVEVN